MTVLLDGQALRARRPIAAGTLAPLVHSLGAALEPLIARGDVWIPDEKARLTRRGGRCPVHGVLLEFDPWQPRAHRCPACGVMYRDEEHYRWWIMNYQLWLAERAVHGAVLHALTGAAECRVLAETILDRYAARYLEYPNQDNVLGPTRPFFSTYLESIWLLQLCAALDLLERCDENGTRALGARVRERLVEPSARLIVEYDEGRSNRQVWNNAALAAASVLLDDGKTLERVISGPSGILRHLSDALLADGTWYEGENYHLFAHRGIWYGATIAATNGQKLGGEAEKRYREGFATPFATALPDFTFPARRDSQYGVSLRQWRIAESCELGLAEHDDPRLTAALVELYRDDVPGGDTGRDRSTAEAERNAPAVRLTRSSLGWKSLLFARETVPPVDPRERVARSAHLESQGLAVLRRDDGRVYVALDYGTAGGGHGHPDRLNLWLVVDHSRILEDMGTGSYVERALHWYRSTLAHNAPLIDGHSQHPVDGRLISWDERGEGAAGWIAAEAHPAPGVTVSRRVIVLPTYVIDELEWTADREIVIDLPWHVDARLRGEREFDGAALGGGKDLEDGFDFARDTERAPARPGDVLEADVGNTRVRGFIDFETPFEWWRSVAPGPPQPGRGSGDQRFLIQRARARYGCFRSVWTWSALVKHAHFEAGRTAVELTQDERHLHERHNESWHIEIRAGAARRNFELAGYRRGAAATGSDASATTPQMQNTSGGRQAGAARAAGEAGRGFIIRARSELPPEPGSLTSASEALVFDLGETHYRRSEAPWNLADAPTARVTVTASRSDLVVEVEVRKASPPVFAPPRDENELDNEHPDINSDGLQLWISSERGEPSYSWLLVPDAPAGTVRVTPRHDGGSSPGAVVLASWRAIEGGYVVRCRVPRVALGSDETGFTLDVVVNEISAGRERRRGQLVLSGGGGEWVYLRGDRQDAARALHFHIVNT